MWGGNVPKKIPKEVHAMEVFAKQKIIYSQPYFKVDELLLPARPEWWWIPKDGAITSVELVGVEPTKEFIEIAQQWGWQFYNGRFYYVGP
jgi:hypothetical protein